MVGDCLHMPFRKIASELWLLWQLIGPIGLLWENACKQCSFFIFCWIFMKLTYKNDMHKISEEFKNGSDWTNNGRVTCPWLSKMAIINLVNSVASSFFVGPSWNLQITMTCIKSQKNLKMGQIWPTIAETRPLNCQNCHYCPCKQHSFFIFCWIFMKLADNNDMHKISKESENRSDPTNDGRVMSPSLSRSLVNTLQPNQLQTISEWCPWQNVGQVSKWDLWDKKIGH